MSWKVGGIVIPAIRRNLHPKTRCKLPGELWESIVGELLGVSLATRGTIGNSCRQRKLKRLSSIARQSARTARICCRRAPADKVLLRTGIRFGSCRRFVLRSQPIAWWRELWGVNVSLGRVQNLGEAASEALAAPYPEVKEAMLRADTASGDETSWQEKGQRHWLGVPVTSTVTLFLVSGFRGQKALPELIGEHFQGIGPSERWSASALGTATNGKSAGRR